MTSATVIARRIRKLEEAARLQDGRMTKDELNIRIWELASGIAAAGDMPSEDRQWAHSIASDIEADIIDLATKQGSPDYRGHLDYCRSRWQARGQQVGYEPALTGAANGMGEYADWDEPLVMERRAALRSRPAVQALLRKAAA